MTTMNLANISTAMLATLEPRVGAAGTAGPPIEAGRADAAAANTVTGSALKKEAVLLRRLAQEPNLPTGTADALGSAAQTLNAASRKANAIGVRLGDGAMPDADAFRGATAGLRDSIAGIRSLGSLPGAKSLSLDVGDDHGRLTKALAKAQYTRPSGGGGASTSTSGARSRPSYDMGASFQNTTPETIRWAQAHNFVKEHPQFSDRIQEFAEQGIPDEVRYHETGGVKPTLGGFFRTVGEEFGGETATQAAKAAGNFLKGVFR